jgi:4-amino-4-deoxy-L-arabinose transferase-like glycosyltransferase
MNIGYNLMISFLCFLAVFALYKYDIWWLKNKLKKQPLNDYDKTVRPIKNLGLKIMLFLMGLIFLSKSFI